MSRTTFRRLIGRIAVQGSGGGCGHPPPVANYVEMRASPERFFLSLQTACKYA
jgi:hypothetical protein